MKDNIAYYDGNPDRHHHFICGNCGVILDVPMEYNEDFNRKLEKEMGVEIEDHEMVFYGLCNKCRKEKEETGEMKMEIKGIKN